MNREKKSLGLTLLELLITIAIVGVISAVGYTTYENGQEKARDAQRKNDLRDIQNALQLYYQDNNLYPTAGSGIKSNNASWDTLLSTDYIKTMPKDPKNTSTLFYRYDSPSGNLTYTLSTDLESENPSAGCNSSQTSSPNHDYCVTNP